MESYTNPKAFGNIVNPGFRSKVVLMEFPYDEGAKVSSLKLGSGYGPECFRKYMKKLGPIQNAEFGIDFSKLSISNIEGIRGKAINDELEKLKRNVKLAMIRAQTAFIIGGTRDLIPYCAKGIMEYDPDAEEDEKQKDEPISEENIGEINPFTDDIPDEPKLHKILIISISPGIDADLNESTTSSKYVWRRIMEDPNFTKSGSKLILFGSNCLCSKENFTYITSKGGSVIWMDDIRKIPLEFDPKFECQTQAGQAFEKLLSSITEEYQHIYISFNMEIISVLFSIIVGFISSWSDRN